MVVVVDGGMPKQNETSRLREEGGGVQRLEDPGLNGTGTAVPAGRPGSLSPEKAERASGLGASPVRAGIVTCPVCTYLRLWCALACRRVSHTLYAVKVSSLPRPYPRR